MEKIRSGLRCTKRNKPQIIYAACSGFGHSGPYRDKPAYDIIVQAMGGMMSITGPEGGEPTRIGASVGDIIAGMFTAYGIAMALFHRERTGAGQKVDVGMLDCQLAVLENAIARYTTTGDIPRPLGNRHPSITPFSSYTAADGHIIVGAGNERLWLKLCTLLGKQELPDDLRFATNAARTAHVNELVIIFNDIFRHKTIAEWLQILEAEGIPCAPINTVDKVISDPHIISREMIVEIDHPIAGKTKNPRHPRQAVRNPPAIHSPAPTLGQHTTEILQEILGWDEEKTEKFFKADNK